MPLSGAINLSGISALNSKLIGINQEMLRVT